MRSCGSCTLCCKLTPVAELHKAAGERCKHVRSGKGCSIYAHRPSSCRWWSCRWLVQPEETPNLSRPDRSHYVIDLVPDYVTLLNNATGERQHIEVIQVWVDPLYPNAHEDPALRAYAVEQQKPLQIRYSGDEGFIIFPPNVASDGKWHIERGQFSEDTHTMQEKMAALGNIELVFTER